MSRYSDERVHVPAMGSPEFVMTGITKPDGTVRLYASREIRDVDWGQRDISASITAWHIEANMTQMLIIDKPTWGEAFAHAFMIWENQDREKERVALEDKQRKLESARMDTGLRPRLGITGNPAKIERTDLS